MIAASEEGPKLLHGESGLSDQAPKQTRTELPVKRHGEDDGGFGLDEAGVAPPLAHPGPTGPLEGADGFLAGAHGKLCHEIDSPSSSERVPGEAGEQRADWCPWKSGWRGTRGFWLPEREAAQEITELQPRLRRLLPQEAAPALCGSPG